VPPLIAPENLFSEIQYPGHTVYADDALGGGEPADHEAFHVARAARSADEFATAVNANQDWWVGSTFDRLRAFNFLAVDRNSNLRGFPVELRASSDGFTTWETILDVVVPDQFYAPADLRVLPGALTEEGAWLARFDDRVYHDVRLHVPAMGAGLKPQVTGLHLGWSYEPTHGNMFPYDPAGRQLFVTERMSDTAWTAGNRPAHRFDGTITIGCPDEDERDVARLYVEGMAWRYRPTWWVPDQARAEQAFYAQVSPGRYSFVYTREWRNGISTFPVREINPRLVA
jgi:hypothetical protein